MSSLTHADVDRIAVLARLALTDEERELFTRQLAEILDYAEQIARVPTDGVTPTSHVQFERTVLRPDVEQTSLTKAEAFRNAPDASLSAGLFRVPKVIG